MSDQLRCHCTYWIDKLAVLDASSHAPCAHDVYMGCSIGPEGLGLAVGHSNGCILSTSNSGTS